MPVLPMVVPSGVTTPSLTPREKRILITHAIGEFHEKITQSNAYERANVATGTWMKISHCLGESGPANLPEDSEVSIQHLNEYNYAQECPRVPERQDSCGSQGTQL